MIHNISYAKKLPRVMVMIVVILTTFWSNPVSAQSKIDSRVLEDTANGQVGHFLVVLTAKGQRINLEGLIRSVEEQSANIAKVLT